jgi:hypothetical protein
MNKTRTLAASFSQVCPFTVLLIREQPSAFMAFERKKERAMLKLIEGSYASFFPKETDAMFRNRAEMFSDRLGWEVTVKDGYERDMVKA